VNTTYDLESTYHLPPNACCSQIFLKLFIYFLQPLSVTSVSNPVAEGKEFSEDKVGFVSFLSKDRPVAV